MIEFIEQDDNFALPSPLGVFTYVDGILKLEGRVVRRVSTKEEAKKVVEDTLKRLIP